MQDLINSTIEILISYLFNLRKVIYTLKMRNKTKYLVFILLLINIVNSKAQSFWVGGTMHYASQLEESGIVFKENGIPTDPYASMKEHGANLVRLSVHLPPYLSSYTENKVVDYTSPDKIKECLRRVKANGMQVLITFPYSSFTLDDASNLNIYAAPLRWQSIAGNLDILKDSVYNYTYKVLDNFCKDGLIPAMVSVGNESTWHLMMPNVVESKLPAWDANRSVTLLNAGSKAVRDIAAKYNTTILVAWHMTSPATTKWWLDATKAYTRDFDIMGLSCYQEWYKGDYAGYNSLKDYISGMSSITGKKFMIMETSQLYTSGNFDNHVNILGNDNIPLGYAVPAVPETQRDYMTDLAQQVKDGGGVGCIYWGNDWIANNTCYTFADKYGKGSSWDDKTFWNGSGELHAGIDWMKPFTSDSAYVTFKVDMTNIDTSNGVWLTGNFIHEGQTGQFVRMHSQENNIFSVSILMAKGSTGYFGFANNNVADALEKFPKECAEKQGAYRTFSLGLNESRKEYRFVWQSCSTIPFQKLIPVTFQVDMTGVNTSKGVFIYGDVPDKSANRWIYIPMTNMGNNIFQYSTQLVNGTSGAFIFANDAIGATKETVPSICWKYWNQYRGYTISQNDQSVNYNYIWGKCNTLATFSQETTQEKEIFCYPNPASDRVTFDLKDIKCSMVQVFNINGKKVFQIVLNNDNQLVINPKDTFGEGVFLVKFIGTNSNSTIKLIVE
jgi:arabinogalactan endo-1,4-beta-galactosidase